MRKKLLILALICIGSIGYGSDYTKVESEYKDKVFNEKVWVKNEAIVNDVVKRKIADSGIQMQIGDTRDLISQLGSLSTGNSDSDIKAKIKTIEEKIQQLEKSLEDLKKTVTAENQGALESLQETIEKLKVDLKNEKIKNKLSQPTTDLTNIENNLPTNPTVQQILDLIDKLNDVKDDVDKVIKDEGGNTQTSAITTKLNENLDKLKAEILKAVTTELKDRGQTALDIQNGKVTTDQKTEQIDDNIGDLRKVLRLLPDSSTERQSLLRLLNNLGAIKNLKDDKIEDGGSTQTRLQNLINGIESPELKAMYTELFNDINKDNIIKGDQDINNKLEEIEKVKNGETLEEKNNKLTGLLTDLKELQSEMKNTQDLPDSQKLQSGDQRLTKEEIEKKLTETQQKLEDLQKQTKEEIANNAITDKINNFKGLDPKDIKEEIDKLTNDDDKKNQTKALEDKLVENQLANINDKINNFKGLNPSDIIKLIDALPADKQADVKKLLDNKLEQNKIDHLNKEVEGIKNNSGTTVDQLKKLQEEIDKSSLTDNEKEKANEELLSNLGTQLAKRISDYHGENSDSKIEQLIDQLTDKDEKQKLKDQMKDQIHDNKVNNIKDEINKDLKTDKNQNTKPSDIDELREKINRNGNLLPKEKDKLLEQINTNLEEQIKNRIDHIKGETPDQAILDLIKKLPPEKQQDLKDKMKRKIHGHEVNNIKDDIEKVEKDKENTLDEIHNLQAEIKNSDLTDDEKKEATDKLDERLKDQISKRIEHLKGETPDSVIENLIKELSEDKDRQNLLGKMQRKVTHNQEKNQDDKIKAVNNDIDRTLGKNGHSSTSSVNNLRQRINNNKELTPDEIKTALAKVNQNLKNQIEKRIENLKGQTTDQGINNLINKLPESLRADLRDKMADKIQANQDKEVEEKVKTVTNNIDNTIKETGTTKTSDIDHLRKNIETSDLTPAQKTTANNHLNNLLKHQIQHRIDNLHGNNPSSEIQNLINKLPESQRADLKNQMNQKVRDNKNQHISDVTDSISNIKKDGKTSPTDIQNILDQIKNLPSNQKVQANKDIQAALVAQIQKRVADYKENHGEKAALDQLIGKVTGDEQDKLQKSFATKQDNLHETTQTTTRNKAISTLETSINNLKPSAIKTDADKTKLLGEIAKLQQTLEDARKNSNGHNDEVAKINKLEQALTAAKQQAGQFKAPVKTPDVGNAKLPQQDFKINGGHFNL